MPDFFTAKSYTCMLKIRQTSAIISVIIGDYAPFRSKRHCKALAITEITTVYRGFTMRSEGCQLGSSNHAYPTEPEREGKA